MKTKIIVERKCIVIAARCSVHAKENGNNQQGIGGNLSSGEKTKTQSRRGTVSEIRGRWRRWLGNLQSANGALKKFLCLPCDCGTLRRNQSESRHFSQKRKGRQEWTRANKNKLKRSKKDSFYFQTWETATCLRNIGESSSLAKCIAAASLPLIHHGTSNEHHICCRSLPIEATTGGKPAIADKISRSALDHTVRLLINRKIKGSKRISHEHSDCRDEERVPSIPRHRTP